MKFLDAEEVRDRLDLGQLDIALETAMKDVSRGATSIPARIAAHVEGKGLLAAMPGYVPSLGVLEAKLVALFPGNADPIPTHLTVIVAFDPNSGAPLAVMEGDDITTLRTAAGSALATRLLAREDSRVVAILGTGVQAKAHARAMMRVRAVDRILVAGRSPHKVAAMVSELESELPVEASDWESAVRSADIVCAATHPDRPVVRGEWLRPGTHVNSVGLSSHGAEVDQLALRMAHVFVEHRATAVMPMPTGANELDQAIREATLSLDEITEIGEVLLGTRPGRTSADEITLYKSVGIAAQDAAGVAVILASFRDR
ncbi:ornithine cyclodeaminase family protein [Fimbriimonas ginsengisoli]|uniref:Alanine dehydrogenase n=1 Tax=Fimbriimonas ginsengisoli Gsoil 348 TaxID=661478 RepID=A0A068NRS6_FIMGI|nr:ornithine cyclodeaminase family protein [Fimbriimonas ginsengisoli]AIE86253.1 alanine dehydrogenase [Fimbriimonas ginsengisoli Gsoil 348]